MQDCPDPPCECPDPARQRAGRAGSSSRFPAPLADAPGFALLAVLLALALLLPLGGLAVLEARSALVIAQNLRARAEARVAAEAALEWAAAAVPALWDTSTLAAGPDGSSGTADDGAFPFGAVPDALCQTLSCELSLAPLKPALWRLRATARGFRGTAATVERILAWSTVPYSPAAAYAAPGVAPRLGTDPVLVDGSPYRPVDPPGLPTGTGPPDFAFAFPDARSAEEARSALAPHRDHIAGRGESPSVGQATRIDLAALAARAAGNGQATSYEGSLLPDSGEFGAPGRPELAVVEGNAVLRGSWSGAGILLVRGQLEITGELRYEGLVVAERGVALDSGARVSVHGALWVAGGVLDLFGTAAVLACPECMGRASEAFPEILPHALEPRGWREIL